MVVLFAVTFVVVFGLIVLERVDVLVILVGILKPMVKYQSAIIMSIIAMYAIMPLCVATPYRLLGQYI